MFALETSILQNDPPSSSLLPHFITEITPKKVGRTDEGSSPYPFHCNMHLILSLLRKTAFNLKM